MARLSEKEAYDLFVQIRYASTGGQASCPDPACGCTVAYEITRPYRPRGKVPSRDPRARHLFKCKKCERHFSVTSGTIFHGHKLSHVQLLLAIVEFVNGAKGISAIHLSRQLGCHYKTAFVLAQKLRSVLRDAQANVSLVGPVEIDGAYFGGYVPRRNLVAERVDRRRKVYRSDKRQCVVVARGRQGGIQTFVCPEAQIFEHIRHLIEPGRRIYTDEFKGFDPLHAVYDVRRINHSNEGFAIRDRTTNRAESFFSRLRRFETGTHHHIAGRYIGSYAAECAWREDNRRAANGDQFRVLVGESLLPSHPAAREWRGYWQRHHRRPP